ncbi:hypothetical protein IHQ71_26645 [Rhizobium sp. TH2]|uniref:hypothetical protein n=1 Tax=Rhizobium sp. TH2 TaxID=2775403 RepID=UPI0021587A16|nr:hypothetical protein [Rhizobium sp. TH2]UVC08665.1 hypothetical protein IHQ71_26645 [Rhizobium sp. TH2]
MNEVEFDRIVYLAANGDAEPLVKWLRSDEHIGPLERDYIAELLEQLIKLNPPKNKRGRPKVFKGALRMAAIEYVKRTRRGENSDSVASNIMARTKIKRSKLFEEIKELKDFEDKAKRSGERFADIENW